MVLSRGAQDLVGLHTGFPLFAGLAVAEVGIDPRDEVARQWHTELGCVELTGTLFTQNVGVDLGDRRRRIIQQLLDGCVDIAELGQQLTHVARAATRSRLVSHRGRPFDQAVAEQAA